MPRSVEQRHRRGPVGTAVTDDIAASLEDAEARAEHERLAPFEALARLVVMRRAALGISQEQLARRMQTTPSAISRLESGQHASNARTLMRLAEALDARAVLGFEYGPSAKPTRQLVVL
jgi:ribosome-binding protein aMBF1 (putative translation factor)